MNTVLTANRQGQESETASGEKRDRLHYRKPASVSQ